MAGRLLVERIAAQQAAGKLPNGIQTELQ